ncbi:signal transduction histidine kinase [Thermocatellispora tengchongensis]|uniref:histidine kinase n=1 Tax=Thermocatellispora tengchongensis TaxID=1073253 RepID=A0A840PDI6_9ACTN|nr:ATP-binding protein [Thermocatellispora tengchongensis]MBB5137678.1 signal transduction histidine kinase [Thermocatellispora tengchongensis]
MAETTSERLTPEELRTLFLFESLTDEQLAVFADAGVVTYRQAGEDVYAEGDPATCFYVLLSGTVALSRTFRGDRVEVSRTDQRGVYAGATQAYLNTPEQQTYANSLRAITDAKLFELPADLVGASVREWFPMAMHLLEGLFVGMRRTQVAISERERLLALGALSAGLTHELNNPAAAAVRATAVLRTRVAGMRHKLAMIADGRLDGSQLHDLVELQEAAVKRAASAPELSPMETSDAEDAMADWLEEHDIAGAWDIAPTLVAGGLDVEWMEQMTSACRGEKMNSAVAWLAYTLETEQLMGEIEDASNRISSLVAAAKQYSQLDRAPYQTVDVHDLLVATLTMMAGKIPPGVKKVKEFDRSLPKIPAYAAELNQVWTNLLDNALGAMKGSGTLTIRTGSDDSDRIWVQIGDTGPGIPEEIRPRIFEPFFTTKPVGEGTGLGLDISYRIVVNKHHGDIKVESVPGDTRFTVYLPTHVQPSE